MRDPILRTKGGGARGARYFKAFGGLHYLKGNSAPYFSLTYEEGITGRRDCEACGAAHREILKHWPDLADLAALHLSDINGEPMHGIANGWYNLAGCFPDAFGERYHRGNSEMQMWKPDGSFDGYRRPTGDECLQFFADHARVTLTEAAAIRDQVEAAAMAAPHSRNAVAKATLATIMEAMRPRWKAEAVACIKRHGLTLYGDPWQPVAALEALLASN
jgi:hypothetical protein